MTLPQLKLVEKYENESKPVFSCECDEPEGKITRNVYLAEFTPELFKKLWEKQKRYRALMGVEIHSFAEFVDFFVHVDDSGRVYPKGLCFIIDDCVGFFWVSDIHYPAYCEGHYTFFDGRHRGRENLVREMVKYLFKTWAFNCIYTQVGAFAKYPLQFVERVGFKREGCLRARLSWKGVWWDMFMYSILRNEAEKWQK